MKVVKVVTIEATFPELKTGAMYQTGRGRGGSVKVAFAAAGRDLFKQPKLRRKQFSMFKATVSIGTVPQEPEGTEGQERESYSDTQDRKNYTTGRN